MYGDYKFLMSKNVNEGRGIRKFKASSIKRENKGSDSFLSTVKSTVKGLPQDSTGVGSK